jgi:hypothetical protein
MVHARQIAARERAAALKIETRRAEEKASEDAKWVDVHKEAEAKQSRAASREAKEAESIRKATEKKELMEAEERELATYGKKKGLAAPTKIKRADIRMSCLANIVTTKNKNVEPVVEPSLLFIDNRTDQELLARGGEVVSARGVNEALKALSEEGDVDMHPEKRQKAAYNAFEARRLPQLKIEFPSLRHTQLKEKLHREWKKSPENPMLDK